MYTHTLTHIVYMTAVLAVQQKLLEETYFAKTIATKISSVQRSRMGEGQYKYKYNMKNTENVCVKSPPALAHSGRSQPPSLGARRWRAQRKGARGGSKEGNKQTQDLRCQEIIHPELSLPLSYAPSLSPPIPSYSSSSSLLPPPPTSLLPPSLPSPSPLILGGGESESLRAGESGPAFISNSFQEVPRPAEMRGRGGGVAPVRQVTRGREGGGGAGEG